MPWVSTIYFIIIIIINNFIVNIIINNKIKWFDYRLSDIRWTVRNDVPGSTQDISLLLLLIKYSDLIIVCLILDEL